MKKSKLILAVITLLGLTACSRIELAYRWGDRLIVSKIDHYFDLTSEQKEKTRGFVKRDLKALLLAQVPVLSAQVQKSVTLMHKRDLNLTEFEAFVEDGRKLFFGAFQQLEPSVTEFLMFLEPKQFEHYEKIALKEQKEKEDDLKDEKSRKKFLTRRIENWFDFLDLDLNKEQKTQFEEYIGQIQYPYDLEFKHQRAMIQKFMTDSKKDKVQFKELIHQTFQDPMQFREKEYKEAMDKYREKSKGYYWSLVQSLTDSQKTKIENKLMKLMGELEKLREKESKS